MNKKQLKLSIATLIVLIFVVLLSTTVYAIEDGEGPYTIIFKATDIETQEFVPGGTFKILKTHDLVEGGQESLLEEAVTVIPEGVESDENGVFTLNEETNVVIPNEYGKGIYKVIQVNRAPNYFKYTSDINIEFPKIEDGQYKSEQSFTLNLELTKIIGGVQVQIFSENDASEMDNYKNIATLEFQRPSGEKEVIEYSNFEDVLLENLPEGEYKLRVTNIVDETLAIPKHDFVFSVAYNEEQDKTYIEPVEYPGRHAAAQVDEAAYRIYLFKKPSATSDNNGIEILSGLSFNEGINIKMPYLIKNYDEATIRIPRKFGRVILSNVQGGVPVNQVDDDFTIEVAEISSFDLSLDGKSNRDSETMVPIKIDFVKGEKVDTFNTQVLTITSKTATLTTDLKIKDSVLTKKTFEPKGEFVVLRTDKREPEKNVVVEDGKLVVSNLSAGAYTVSYKPDKTEKLTNTDNLLTFYINETTATRDNNYQVGDELTVTTKASMYQTVALVVVAIILAAVAFFLTRNTKKKGKVNTEIKKDKENKTE